MPSGGSHPRYREELRDIIKSQLEANISGKSIAAFHGVSVSFVSQLNIERKTPIEVLQSVKMKRGRKAKLGAEEKEVMESYIEEHPTSLRSELVDFLRNEFDVKVSVETVGRTLKELKLSRKRLGRVNRERDEDLRAQFRARIAASYTADQLVAVDESAANEQTGDRKFGWSPVGVPCRSTITGRRSERWSILPALSTEGIIHYEIFHGSFNRERFENFIEVLIGKINRYPAPQSVILLDNASIHHHGGIKDICDAAGVLLEYLPPYSPDLNPIELSFHELKEWLRRNRDLAEEYCNWFEGLLHLALNLICDKETAQGYFRKCGYGDID